MPKKQFMINSMLIYCYIFNKLYFLQIKLMIFIRESLSRFFISLQIMTINIIIYSLTPFLPENPKKRKLTYNLSHKEMIYSLQEGKRGFFSSKTSLYLL